MQVKYCIRDGRVQTSKRRVTSVIRPPVGGNRSLAEGCIVRLHFYRLDFVKETDQWWLKFIRRVEKAKFIMLGVLFLPRSLNFLCVFLVSSGALMTTSCLYRNWLDLCWAVGYHWFWYFYPVCGAAWELMIRYEDKRFDNTLDGIFIQPTAKCGRVWVFASSSSKNRVYFVWIAWGTTGLSDGEFFSMDEDKWGDFRGVGFRCLKFGVNRTGCPINDTMKFL